MSAKAANAVLDAGVGTRLVRARSANAAWCGRAQGAPLRTLCVALLGLMAAGLAFAANEPVPVQAMKDGKLEYLSDARGNRVPDYSHAGYRGGGVALPVVPARVRVAPVDGDDGSTIQAALDHVATLPLDAQGLRGAVELAPGKFEIAGQIRLTASGVVLRGAGAGAGGTTLLATGTDRRALIEVAGADRPRALASPVKIIERYVPVGAVRLRVAQPAAFAAGTRVRIERESTAEWIKAVGMDWAPGRQPFQWRPGKINVEWERVVVAVEQDALVLDAPLTTALEAKLAPATVTPFVQEGYLTNVGVEHLRCESSFDPASALDEQHAWNAIDLHAVRDAWVSDVTAAHFAGSAVQVGAKASRVTLQDCRSIEPISEVAGYRRLAFHVRGQQVLVLRGTSEKGRNDFVAGHGASGPIAFVDCVARETSSFSGSIAPWVSGLLFDSVSIDGGALRLDNLETFNQGVGWAAANSMAWGCEAGVIVSRRPPGAMNWAVAVWGQFVGDGRWSLVTEFANPKSLYRAQLVARLGERALAALEPRRYAPATEAVPMLAALNLPAAAPAERPDRRLALEDGRLQVGGKTLSGKQTEVAWWRGRMESSRAKEVGPALTRFAPGRAGTGLTDEIPAVAKGMVQRGEVLLRHHYGLWHDRRRDDHQLIRRPDAEVWPPFFEQPFLRSGQGKAWDGLSRYDLTRYNPWYFGRLKAFAAEARRHGLVLVNEMYFQHNLIESAAHWVDSPWRPVNNINDTGFTEPPPFDGDTIKMANEFYDVNHPVRRGLHRAYIRQCLANLADEPNVIHTLTAENSGPLHFMQFWLDVIEEWKRETGKHPLIALSAPKDVQDAILADPARGAVVDVIDLTYWFRTGSGDEFAPKGGRQLAPRQELRKWKGGRPNAASIAAMAAEYRAKFPGKAVISGLPEAAEVQP
jgi:hypothetical protein